MAYLIQDSSSINDCTKFSIYKWINLPGPQYVFQFGGTAIGDPTRVDWGYVRVLSDGTISVIAKGPIVPTLGGGPGENDRQYFGFYTDPGVFTFNAWNHIAIAAKIQDDGSFAPDPVHSGAPANPGNVGNTAKIVLNGVSQSLKGSNPYGTTGINTTNGGLYGYRLSMPFGATPDPGTGILINGTPIGLPIVPNTITEVDPPTRRRYADVQGWFGTFIDPTDPANYAKFVTLSHGGANGTNVKPSVAAASFGPQSLLFTGGKNRFYTNRGIGGAFTKVGTIIDSSGPGF